MGDGEWPHSAAFDLLLRRRPDEEDVAAGCRLAVGLVSSCLPVQGPPGTGKTYTGARQIIDLVSAGKHIGVNGELARGDLQCLG